LGKKLEGVEAPRGVGSRKGLSPSALDVESGDGAVPPFQKEIFACNVSLSLRNLLGHTESRTSQLIKYAKLY